MASQTTRVAQDTITVVMEVPVTLVVSIDIHGIPIRSMSSQLRVKRYAGIASEVDSSLAWRIASSPVDTRHSDTQDCIVSNVRMQPAHSKTKLVGFFTREKTTPPASRNGGRNGHKV